MLVLHCNFVLHWLSKFKIYDITILLSNGSKQILNLVCLFDDVDCCSLSPRLVCLIVCLFGVFVPLENFHSYGYVTIANEGLQILTYVRHTWPLSSEGSLALKPTVTRGILLREPVTLAPVTQSLEEKLSLPVLTN